MLDMREREQFASNNEGYARLEAIRPLRRERNERIKRSFWAWVGVTFIVTPWLTMYAVAEFVLHLLKIPHWH